MHLNRSQVQEVVGHLQVWLETGSFVVANIPTGQNEPIVSPCQTDPCVDSRGVSLDALMSSEEYASYMLHEFRIGDDGRWEVYAGAGFWVPAVPASVSATTHSTD
jgi:hypothetical protein